MCVLKCVNRFAIVCKFHTNCLLLYRWCFFVTIYINIRQIHIHKPIHIYIHLKAFASPFERAHLLHGGFFNPHGLEGHCIPGDLRTENLVRKVKSVTKPMGNDRTDEEYVIRFAQKMDLLEFVEDADIALQIVSPDHHHHAIPDAADRRKRMVLELQELRDPALQLPNYRNHPHVRPDICAFLNEKVLYSQYAKLRTEFLHLEADTAKLTHQKKRKIAILQACRDSATCPFAYLAS